MNFKRSTNLILKLSSEFYLSYFVFRCGRYFAFNILDPNHPLKIILTKAFEEAEDQVYNFNSLTIIVGRNFARKKGKRK